jgi:hypothetical protein
VCSLQLTLLSATRRSALNVTKEGIPFLTATDFVRIRQHAMSVPQQLPLQMAVAAVVVVAVAVAATQGLFLPLPLQGMCRSVTPARRDVRHSPHGERPLLLQNFHPDHRALSLRGLNGECSSCR